jgi:hypothetical protein
MRLSNVAQVRGAEYACSLLTHGTPILDILITLVTYKPDSIVDLSMRRLAAHLALAAIWLGSLGPFVAVAQLSAVPACCLRSGLHHCQNSAGDTPSSDPEFHAAKTACPYSAPLPPTSFRGLKASRFSLASPTGAGFVGGQMTLSALLRSAFALSARGPPVLL